MNNFVISLIASTQRRSHILEEFNKQNIPFHFFDAITPATLTTSINQFNIDNSHSTLTLGEQACFMSHLELIHLQVEKQLPYITIFEDDVHLGQNATAFLTNTQWLPTMDIMKLETHMHKVRLSNSFISIYRRKLRKLNSAHVGCCGYIVSLAGAKKIMNYVNNNPECINTPIDLLLFEDLLGSLLNVWQMTPALTIQNMFLDGNLHSSLAPERKLNPSPQMTRQKKTITSKIIRELSRPFYQLYTWMFLGFLTTVRFK